VAAKHHDIQEKSEAAHWEGLWVRGLVSKLTMQQYPTLPSRPVTQVTGFEYFFLFYFQ
jgi:hypothetical protein